MVLSQRLHEAFKGAVERMTGPRTVSAFKEKGVLTPDEFVEAGDNLVSKCPTWSWYFHLTSTMFSLEQCCGGMAVICMPQSCKISIHAFEPVLWFGFYSMSALCNLKGAISLRL
jgi:hypothetical protein